jgi:diaminohydroxyphosphoribosylaminopyrimidine deaminase/5-amino-6-(5-phosphoribosylamino)uracil reductase
LGAAGIDTGVGLLADQAAYVNAPFFHYHRTGLPFVALKAAMSLDGKAATRTGDSKWITGEQARAWVHRLRAQHAAILCGVGTVVADDPLLNARFPRAPRTPVRVVIDPTLRIPLESQLVQTAPQIPTIVVAGDQASVDRAKNLQSYQVDILRATTDINGHIPLKEVLAELGARGIISVLVEGGGTTNSAFISQRQAHRVYWFVAPKLVGGKDAPTPLEGAGAESMSEAIQLEMVRMRRIGRDLLIEGIPTYESSA